jgi:glycyl-tRNA synthetase
MAGAAGRGRPAGAAARAASASRAAIPDSPQTFVLEIGSEELPAGDLDSALRQLRVAIPELLEKERLAHGTIRVHGTPRRLAVIVEDLAPRQPDLETVVKGPPAERAFDVDGNPTRAAEGFARGKGIGVHQLHIVEEGDKRYAAATVREKGRTAVDVLADALPGPHRRLTLREKHALEPHECCLQPPVALARGAVWSRRGAVQLCRRQQRADQLRPAPLGLAGDYHRQRRQLRKVDGGNGIVIDVARRQELIQANAAQLASEKGGVIASDPDLLAEVANLVERPTPLIGSFQPHFLELPAQVLIAVMKKHQRYFPVQDGNGQLLPHFVAVRNGDREHLDMVRAGNEHVIRARFADAAFFYERDSQRSLADFLPDLATLTFQFDLGSMLDKVHRLEALVPAIGAMLPLDDNEQEVAARAAALSKADLATNMVVEMTSLQGVMGGHYALRSGEPEAVATAIASSMRL